MQLTILFASAMMICIMNTMVFATEKIVSAANMNFSAAGMIIPIISTPVIVR